MNREKLTERNGRDTNSRTRTTSAPRESDPPKNMSEAEERLPIDAVSDILVLGQSNRFRPPLCHISSQIKW